MAFRHLQTTLHRLQQSYVLRLPKNMSSKSIQQKNFDLSDVQFAFFVAPNTENEFAWSFDTLKHHFFYFTNVVFSDVQMPDYEFVGQIATINHHLSNVIHVDLFDEQDAENEFAWSFDTLNHRFIDFNKVVFLRCPGG
jgi:hypothetical protein